MSDHYLPSKLPIYLQRLELEYARVGEGLLLSIIRNAHSLVVPETTYDNWNGGTYGHDVLLFLPRDVMSRIQLGKQSTISERLCTDLNTCATGVSNENFSAVNLELEDQTDPQFQQAKPFSNKPPLNPERLAIWTPGFVRLFVSHRDAYKREAQRLSAELASYGISCFVAHDTIQPMEVWQHEIEKGLGTMEIMLAMVTDDFHESVWTNQEIGFALGNNIPIITLKLGKVDPKGFIAERQALKADLERLEDAANEISGLVAERLGHRGRLQQALIAAFAATSDWNQARIRFKRLDRVVDKLSDRELAQITSAFESNPQLHNAIYLTNEYRRLLSFLEGATGKRFKLEGKKIVEQISEVAEDDEIPF